MHIYQLKIKIKPYKPEEFISSMQSYLLNIRKEKQCLDFRVCQDSNEENTYIVLGEWETREAMKKHFHSQAFELMIGAARVLGETFVMKIAEISKTGGFEMAKKEITSEQ